MNYFIQKVFFFIREKIGIGELSRNMAFLKEIAVEDYYNKNVYNNPKYSDPKRLNKYEYNIFSQSGEDGIIEEIFKRVGTTNKFFVEFGVSDGLENCTAALLISGWKGAWFEGNNSFVKKIEHNFKVYLERMALSLTKAFITTENIESLFSNSDVPKEFDL
jgi:hypothetical protein